MKKPLLIGAALLYVAAFVASLAIRASTPEGQTASDVSRLMSARVHEVIPVRTTSDIAAALDKARRNNLKIAISGARHSQGGQTFYPDAIVLDMKKYNRVLNVDRANRMIRVQSGATWDDVQQAINRYGLAIRVMQSSNIFTIGGSISANAHGRDPREGPLIDTIESFRLMKADGSVIHVSRTENAEWFPLVIGGYGLFGVVLDADIRLTDDEMVEERTLQMDVERFPEYFAENVRGNPVVSLTIARLSTAPASFLKEMYVTNYEMAAGPRPDNPPDLKVERAVELTKFLFGLSRKYDWGKNVSWALQKRIFASENETILSRNNAMRPEIEFLEYRDVQRTDLLQEYFIPADRYVKFVEGLGKVVRGSGLNLVNITVRYVPANTDAALSYSKEDCFALVLLFNHRRDARGISQLERATQDMVDLVLQQGGSYYLTYQLFPTPEQMNAAYPGAEAFFQLKKKLDPNLLFMNEFYARYAP